MHTAQVSPRLGLMIPASNDDFEIDDFVDTMTILDTTPGYKIVANYSALSALTGGLTTAQNNQLYLQADNGALWQWIKPGSAAGTWRRANTCTFFQETSQAAQISTTQVATGAGPIIVQNSFAIPGGRNLQASLIGNFSNNADIASWVVELYVTQSGTTSALWSGIFRGPTNGAVTCSLQRPLQLQSLAPGSTVNVFARVRCISGIGGTTIATAGTRISVWEI